MRIVIRAGGVGTRLWPWSRSDMPKQFLPMFDGKSCVQVAWKRFTGSGLAAPEDIYLSVGKAHQELVREQLPGLSPEHLIVEPSSRDTAPAIGLETIHVASESPQAVVASLGSDHFVGKPDVFVKALQVAERFLAEEPDYLLAVACEPGRIETNYGHIKKGAVLKVIEGMPVHVADEFTEKPDYRQAEHYTRSGQYLWNANFFVWSAGTLLRRLEEHEPEMHEGLMRIKAAIGGPGYRNVLEEVYPMLKKVAVDYAVLEPVSREGGLVVLPVAMEWSDIGSWGTITDAFPPDSAGNLFAGPVRAEDVRDTTVFIKNPDRKVVALIGTEGLAVVDTPDVLLICPKEMSGRVKKIVQDMKRSDMWSDLV